MKSIYLFFLTALCILYSAIFLLPSFTEAQTPACTLKSQGDSDCNGTINIVDFEIFRKELTGELTTKTSDFNAGGTVDIVDFELWRKGCFAIGSCATGPTIPVATATIIPSPTIIQTPLPTPTTGGSFLFQDSFETAPVFNRDNPNGWWVHSQDPLNETNRSQDFKRSGQWGLKTTTTAPENNNDHWDTKFGNTSFDALHMRIYLYIGADYVQPNLRDHNHILGFSTTRGSGEFVDAGLDKVASNPDKFALTFAWQDNAGTNKNHNDLPPQNLWFEKEKWYAVEIAHYTSATGGGTKLWINGQLAIDHSGNNITAWKVTGTWIGTCIKSAGIMGNIYFDDVVLSTSYIGP